MENGGIETAEKIQAKSEVIVDGDLSDVKVNSLIRLQREEESLDYKETIDFNSALSQNRAKLDIVCDIVSMANTRGGYLLVGVKETTGNGFSVEGVDDRCIKALDQADIQNWLQRYVDAIIRVTARTLAYEDGQIVVICVLPAKVPIPFRQHGQYAGPDGKSVTKFNAGELFVRHGSKSERASYEDFIWMAEKIRRDERDNINPASSILSRLDMIVHLLGGVPPVSGGSPIMDMSEDDIETHFFQLLKAGNPIVMKRELRKEFGRITSFLQSLKNGKSFEEVIESLDRTFLPFLVRLFPPWICAMEADSAELAAIIVKNLYELFTKCPSMQFVKGNTTIDDLWLRSHIVYMAYCLGAFAVKENRSDFAQMLIGKKAELPGVIGGRSWFRYVLTMLSRAERLPSKSLCTTSAEFLRDRTYVVERFGGLEELTDALCQFDFLQCAHSFRENYTFIKTGTFGSCYPSFGTYYKKRVTPIVESIIRTREQGMWLPRMSDDELSIIMDSLDRYAAKEFWTGVWDYSGWPDEIRQFIDANMPKKAS